jgi:FkbM family methyltransferase
MTIKSVLKRVRSSPSINHLSTSLLRRIFTLTKWQSQFVVKHLPRVGVTEVQLPNGGLLKIESDIEHSIPTQLFWHGWLGYEPEVTPLFYDLARKAGSVIDVGAHFGLFSLVAAIANPNAQVVAIEPLERIFGRLEGNVALNKLKNVHCIRAAAGATEGTAEFYFPNENAPVASSLRRDLLEATIPEENLLHVNVPVVTLDGVVSDLSLKSVGLIKLDTERTEHDVLAGCRQTLERDRPDIICEVWPDANNAVELESLLLPLDYHFYHLLPEGPLHRDHIIPSEDALNYLFTTHLRNRERSDGFTSTRMVC